MEEEEEKEGSRRCVSMAWPVTGRIPCTSWSSATLGWVCGYQLVVNQPLRLKDNLFPSTNTESDEEEDEVVPFAKRQKRNEASSSTRPPHLTSLPSSSSTPSSTASSSSSPPSLFYFTRVRGIDKRFNSPDLAITIRGQCIHNFQHSNRSILFC